MKLLTKELVKQFAKQGKVEDDTALVLAKFFTPWTGWTWYASEWNPETRTFFGLVKGLETELGYFSLDELESVQGPFGLKIERDLYWDPKPVGKVREALDEGKHQ